MEFLPELLKFTTTAFGWESEVTFGVVVCW
jgi:hypothetical protein